MLTLSSHKISFELQKKKKKFLELKVRSTADRVQLRVYMARAPIILKPNIYRKYS